MLYLIDTYNLLHAAAGFGGMASDLTVRTLCQFIVAATGSSGRGSGMRVTLVLDGRSKPQEPSENEFPDITLVYSGIGITADTVIGQRVERAKSRKKLTVVSNDREVTRHARRHFAGAMSCEAFLKLLTRRAPRQRAAAMPANKDRRHANHRRDGPLDEGVWSGVGNESGEGGIGKTTPKKSVPAMRSRGAGY